MKESAVSNAIRTILAPVAARVYSTEAGAMVTYDTGERKARVGGTRTTPGVPDCFALMLQPIGYMLTVEFKGSTTPINPEQWDYAKVAAQVGTPHLIVRRQEAFITGLNFLGLLPRTWVRMLPTPHNFDIWPENWYGLELMRTTFWDNHKGQCSYVRQGLALPDAPRTK